MRRRSLVPVTVVPLLVLVTGGQAYAGKPAAPVVSFTLANPTVENFGPMIVGLTRTGNTNRPLTVSLTPTQTSVGDDATVGADVPGTTVVVTFARKQAGTNVLLAITDDTATEADETFSLVLSNPSLGTVGAPTTATIVDDDQSGAVTVPDGDGLAVDGSITGCNELAARLVDATGSVITTVASKGNSCGEQFFSTTFWQNDTGGAVTARLELFDASCQDGYRFFSDGTSAPGGSNSDPGSDDHAAAWGSSPMHIRITDVGACVSNPPTRQPGANDLGNLVGRLEVIPAT